MDAIKKQHDDDLKKLQKEYLNKILNSNWKPCLHDGCTQCLGTGVKIGYGTLCIHHISCSCPKCTPQF